MREFNLEDGFMLSEILDKTGINLDLNMLADAYAKGGQEGQAYAGGQLILTIFKKMHLAKDEIIKLIAGLTEEPVEEVKKYSLAKIKATFTEMFAQQGIKDFFKAAGDTSESK